MQTASAPQPLPIVTPESRQRKKKGIKNGYIKTNKKVITSNNCFWHYTVLCYGAL